MKNFALKTSIAGLSLMALGAANAQTVQSGTVNFVGSISPVTCTVNAGDVNQTINFGSVAPNATGFAGGGTTIGQVAMPAHQKNVVIRLDNCTTPGQNNHPSKVLVKFTASPGPGASAGINAGGRFTSSNTSVDIQLLENGTTLPWDLNTAHPAIDLVAGRNTLNFIARYYVASVPLTMGQANANATFNMDYQ